MNWHEVAPSPTFRLAWTGLKSENISFKMCEFFSLYASLVSKNCFQNKFDFNINIVQDNYASTSVAFCPRLRRSFVKIHILNDRPLSLKYNCHICFYCVFTVFYCVSPISNFLQMFLKIKLESYFLWKEKGISCRKLNSTGRF